MARHVNVIIAGGGPAGTAAAITLSRANHEVILLETESFPRYRPGESLHPGVESLFERLGVSRDINNRNFLRNAGQRVQWDDQRQLQRFGSDENGDWLGYQIPRGDLDMLLLEEAIRCGTEVWQPCRATRVRVLERRAEVKTNRGELTADWVLDATGRHQLLSRQLHINIERRSHPLTARFGYVELSRSHKVEPEIEKDDTGWTWIAPVDSQQVSWVRLRFDGVDPGKGWVPKKLQSGTAIGVSRGADVTWRIASKTASESWFLLGDAACVVDPASSHGAIRAIMSGIHAAHLIRECHLKVRSNESAATDYHQWLMRWFEGDLERLRAAYMRNSTT